MAACSVTIPPAQSRLPKTTATERAQVYFANARLPATLPTPLLPTPPCLVILPASPPKPSRADSDERWDARKNNSLSAAPGRADAAERWDAHKPFLTTSPSSSSSHKWKHHRAMSSRADAADRWDAQKKKQPRSPPQGRELDDDDDDRSSTGSNDVELATPQRKHAFYAGPGFSIVSPDPGMLPMPSFMVRVA